MAQTVSPDNRFLPVLLSFSLIVCLHAGRAAAATIQESQAFDTITLAVEGVGSAALGSFGESWDAGFGARVHLSTPFYAGLAGAGVHVFGHDALAPDLPEFDAAYVYLGWAYGWTLPRRILLGAGFRLGIQYMKFDDEYTPSPRATELETGFAFASEISYAVSARWSLVFDAEYRKVLTRQPIEYVFAGVGLGRAFVTPRWLKEFLE